jgi:P27 family predicted phage terminase small subunit
MTEEIRREYEMNKTSFAKLGKKHNLPPKRIQAYAKKNGWTKFNPLMVLDVEVEEPQSHKVHDDVKAILGDSYRDIDSVLISMYIDSYTAYIELKELISKEGRIIISEKTGSRYINPNVNLLQTERNNIMKLGKELGINTSTRIRLGIEINNSDKKEASIFDLLEGLDEDIIV